MLVAGMLGLTDPPDGLEESGCPLDRAILGTDHARNSSYRLIILGFKSSQDTYRDLVNTRQIG